MSRLYGDLLQSSGRRFYFSLEGAPGVVTPAPAVLTLLGRAPAAAEPSTVFRTPAPAVLTLSGLSLGSPSVVSPAPAALSMVGAIPNEVRSLTITPALPAPVENPPEAFAPTLITIWTTQPGVAQLTLQTLEQHVTQGGNIGFVSPGAAQLTLQTLGYTILFGEAGVGALTVVGHVPTIIFGGSVTPDVCILSLPELVPEVAIPFQWIDDDPAPETTWISDAAA
jgi:hypothetical protein